MINGWYHLQPGTPGAQQPRELEPPASSTERFYQQMKSIHARAAAERPAMAIATGAPAHGEREAALALLPGPELPAPVESLPEVPLGSPQESCLEAPKNGPAQEENPPTLGESPDAPEKEGAPAEVSPSPAALPETSPGETGSEASPPAEGGKTGYRPPTQHELERAFAQKQRRPDPLPQASAKPGIGAGGPLMQDGRLHETLAAFLQEQVRGRAVHAKGYGALGYFLTEHPMAEFTTLSFLQEAGRRIPAVARFSLAVGGQGAPDMARGIRGFAVKLYANDGNFDLLCNHIPVFPVRDALRFPALIQALGPDPVSGLHSPQRFWEFAAAAPEATHFLTWLYADTGTPKSLRRLSAGSVNTYAWVNGKGERRYVRYHLLPAEGESYATRQEAAQLAAEDPDMAGRELFQSIAAGRPAEYALLVQLMEPQERQGLPYDPLDATKLWDTKRYPLLPVGRLVLDRNPADYRQQVENLAFSPMNLLPGAQLSEDTLLLGRALLYWDAQRLRLGEGFRSLPVNCRRNRAPWSPADLAGTGLGEQVFWESERLSSPQADDFSQAGEHYRALPEIGQEHLVGNIAAELCHSRPDVQAAILGYLAAADAGLAAGVAEKL